MKSDVRKRMLTLRNSLTDKEIELRSYKINKNLFSIPEFQNANSVLFYVSNRSEVRTEKMIGEALRIGKKVFVPVCDVENCSIKVCEIKGLSKLDVGSFGILEPRKEFREFVSTDKVDLIIVPGIVFDTRGNRIGYGRGFYDRFLADVKKPKIALAYDFQILSSIAKNANDVSVDKIVTEERVIDCV